MRKWTVAGGVLQSGSSMLLVENLRRNGSRDWSPPGGVVDPGESVLEALTREVAEETGLTVHGWSRQLYEVDVVAHDMNWHMRAEIWLATTWSGDISIDDPDGIVTEARWVDHAESGSLLARAPRWLSEPVGEWQAEPWPDGIRRFGFDVTGVDRSSLSVVRRPA